MRSATLILTILGLIGFYQPKANAQCQVDIDVFPSGLDIFYSNNSTGQYDSLLWDFGDGTTSTDSFGIHTYAAPGTYWACFYLFFNGSVCDSLCDSIEVMNSNCMADFTSSSNGLNVQFANFSTGSFNEVFWDFGDGFGFSDELNPAYTYITAGTYEVCLEVFDTNGSCFDFYCEDITVSGGGGGGGGGCAADFIATTNELEVNCQNLSTGNYTNELWSFGDGSFPSASSSHVYSAPGTYNVCLTITNILAGCFDLYCEDVTVSEFTCETDFTYSFNSANAFQFQNTTPAGFTDVEWSFGDGNSTSFLNPSYTYNAPGTYEVCLKTFDGEFLCGEECKEVDVYPLGISDRAQQGLQIYPNPSDASQVFVKWSSMNGEPWQVEVMDLTGRVLSMQQLNAQSSARLISWEGSSGTYVIKATDGRGNVTIERVLVR